MNEKTTTKEALFLNQATNNLKNAVRTARANGSKVVSVEEMNILGKANSNVITLFLKNNSDVNEYDMMFGTPLGVASEFLSIPANASFPNIMFTGLADLEDNQGVGIPSLQELNIRFLRKPVYISHIEVIAPPTTKGQSQKGQQVRYYEVPYNFMTDSTLATGKYVPVYTEFTGVTILGSGVMVGEFNGFAYKLLTQSEVNLNIHLAAIDAPTFMFRG